MKLLLVCFSLIFFIGCQENPYDELKNKNDGRYSEREPEPPREVEPPLALAVDDIIEFREGRLLKYKIQVRVREPGVALVTVDDLPPGATFDNETKEISWTPDFFAGNDARDPSIKQRSYPVTIWLRSSLDDKNTIKKDIRLRVNDVPREIKITSNAKVSVRENQSLVYNIKVDNADYPVGPFKIITSKMPANTVLTQIDENNFKLEFTPDFYHVNLVKETSVTYNPKLVISNPANHVQEKDFQIIVKDSRLGVNLQTPNSRENPVLEQGVDASFQVAAYDLNKEVTPKIRLTSNAPEFGTFKTELVENKESHSSVLNIKWSDIPPSKNGEVIDVEFESCVLDSPFDYSNCSTKVVKIKIVVKERKSPIISRSNWSQAQLIYLGFNERVEKNLNIRDGEDARIQPLVEIFPVEMRKYVTWRKNKISMKFSESGVFQFTVKASSQYGTSTTETFQVEIFPQDRSQTLFFADSTRDPEVKFYMNNIKDISLMNPLIQRISLRNISSRETLVLGTSVLFDNKSHKQISKAMGLIKNLVIASPLLANMPASFLKELREDYNMDFIGRYNDLPNTPALASNFIAHTAQFQSPKSKVKLKLSSSVESKNPLIFNSGLDEPNENCQSVLGLTPNGNNPYVIGVACKRNNGGRLVLLGTEWSDLKVKAGDENIPTAWFNTMLKGTF